MAHDMKLSAIRMSALGAGGAEGLSNRHYGKAGSELKKQYKYLKSFGETLSKEGLTEAQLLQRAGQYSRQSAISFHASQQITKEEEGFTEGRRSLDEQSRHCADCPSYNTNGEWIPISQIVPTGTRCKCGGRCRCRVDFRRVEISRFLVQEPRLATR
jgi:hypothetical protein